MYFIFNKYGQFDFALSEAPSTLSNGSFVLEGDLPDGDNFYLFSDGQHILAATQPPPSKYHRLVNGEWEIPAGYQTKVLDDGKTAKLQLLNAAAQAYIDRAAETDRVPGFEMQTWALQAAEAKAWSADNAAPTPVLDQIAASRGVDAGKLKAAALRKTLAYEQLTAHIAGQRQALQAKIEAAKTQAALDKIVIEFTPPEAV